MRLLKLTGEVRARDPAECALPITRDPEGGAGVFFADGQLALAVNEELTAAFDRELGTGSSLLFAGVLPEKLEEPVLEPAEPEEVRRIRDGRYFGPALVYLDFSGGGLLPVDVERPSVAFTACTFSEALFRGPDGMFRVHRDYHPLERAVGVDVLRVSEHGEALVRLWPGASLRVVRADQDCQVLVVRNRGYTVTTSRPDKPGGRRRRHRPAPAAPAPLFFAGEVLEAAQA